MKINVRQKKKKRFFKRAHQQRKFIVTAVEIVIFLFVLMLVLTWMIIRVRPIILEMAGNSAGDIIEYVINEAVREEIETSKANYSEIVNFEKNASGDIKAVYTNTVKINNIKSGIIMRVQQKLRKYDTIEVKVPLGAIFDLELFPALGPRIRFEMISSGFVNADFSSKFDSAGINQTKHQIDVVVEAELGVVGAMGNRSVNVVTSVPVVQSIIVGSVPDRYSSSDTY